MPRNKKEKSSPTSGEFFIKQTVKTGKQKRTRYRDSRGRFVSEEKALKSKKPIYNNYEGKTIKPGEDHNYIPVHFQEQEFSGEMWLSSARSAVVASLENGKKIGIKVNGKAELITENDLPYFESFLSDYFKTARKMSEALGESPQVRIIYREFSDGMLFDFDDLFFLSEEMQDEVEADENLTREYNLQKARITRTKNRYYGKKDKNKSNGRRRKNN